MIQGAASTTGLGQYGTALLNPLAAMTGWASSLATGQPTSVPTPNEFAIQAGPGTYKRGGGKVWASQFDPTTGLVTFTNPGNPRQTWTSSLAQAGSEMNIDPSIIKQWQSDFNAYQQFQRGGGAKGGAMPSPGPQLSLAWQDIQAQQEATKQMPGIEAQTQAFINRAGGQAAVQESQAQQLFGVGYHELSDADKQIVDANALVKMTTTGEGLFPAQQAMIEQARASEETQLASTLGGVGLGRSTQLAQLTGATDLASAATAGALQQGNIEAAEQVLGGAVAQRASAQQTLGLAQQAESLSQAAEKLTLAGQTLLAGEQAQLTQELQNITTQSVQFQQTMWGEAMQGYGMMGDILSKSAQSYGLSLQAYTNVLGAMEEHSRTEANLQAAAAKADQEGTSSLFQGLGQLFGSGGSGTNLLSGLGGLFGGGSAAGIGAGVTAAGGSIGAGEAATAAIGAAGGASGALAGVGTALTALFCEVAQEVYGFDNPKWERFRKWLLFRGPRWFLRWYGQNARFVAAWLRDRPRIKWVLSHLMDAIAR